MDILLDPNIWFAFLTLAALEIVLGIDNVIFLSIMANKLPEAQRARARQIGLAGAALTRIGLLFSLAWITRLTSPLFTIFGEAISGRDIVLLGGGLFLLTKATMEIHHQVQEQGQHLNEGVGTRAVAANFLSVIVQIMVLDIVFSLDSVITAVGMTDQLGVMVAAILAAVAVMILFAGPVSRFVEHHPTIKVLALSFLMLIGMALIGEGLDMHVPKGYIYFAMAFSTLVEIVNLRVRRNRAA
ncbi:TerC family protein [Flagellatimonas centrodinii]|uniref:TerC family protein n=1 Tax=Flagellatimonas centrodinii TaxID=2806210 RepID=UPI001FEF9E5D|nr:TerC family protein [Flagellatimonas centrodinii]ULQ45127.1 TerC family protein [Flagellatimonas centrodinii]